MLLHKHRFPDKGNSNHWQPYIKKVFSKFYNKYQKIKLNNQTYIIIQKPYFQQTKQKKQKISINFFQNKLGDIVYLC